MFTPSATIGFIGFGEAGGMLAEALARRGCAVRAWDILLDDARARAAMLARIEDAGVDPAGSLADCMQGAKLVVLAVTTNNAAKVADAVGALLQPGQLTFDLGAVSPEGSGADYIDAALNALGFPKRAVADDFPRPPRRGELP